MYILVSLVFGLTYIFFVYFIQPILKRFESLQKDYQNISVLPISSIQFLGNNRYFTGTPTEVFQLFKQLSKQCHEQCKGIYCVWLCIWPSVVICSGEALEGLINNTKQLVKSFDYTLVEPWLKTGLLTSKNEKWKNRRRLLTPSFHNSQLLNNFVLIFNEQARIISQRFNQLSIDSNKTFNLYSLISECTLDIITEAATGTNPKAQSGDEKNEFVQATLQMSEIIAERSRTPWMWPNFIFNLLPIGRHQRQALKVLHRFSREVIENRLKEFQSATSSGEFSDIEKDKRRLVFLDCLITQMKAEKLTIDDIQEEVDTFMFEGHDTTAAAINYLLYLVGSHPEVQEKIHQEIDSIFGDDTERFCTIEDTQKMIYLDCVIKESLRILPSVPFIGREVQEDFAYRDQIIRKGTSAVIFIYGIHHDENIFPNPDRFDPSRFEMNIEHFEQRSPYAFIPFSAGSRNCIGQRFAGLEERVILSTLFRQFSFSSTQTIDELKLKAELILRPDVPIQIQIKKRHKSSTHS